MRVHWLCSRLQRLQWGRSCSLNSGETTNSQWSRARGSSHSSLLNITLWWSLTPTRKVGEAASPETGGGELWSYLSTFLWLELQLAGGRSGSDQASHPARLLWISWPEQAQTLQDSDRRLDWALLSSLTSHVTVNLWKFPPKQTEIINNTLLDRPLYIVWQTSGCKNLALSHWEMQFNGY